MIITHVIKETRRQRMEREERSFLHLGKHHSWVKEKVVLRVVVGLEKVIKMVRVPQSVQIKRLGNRGTLNLGMNLKTRSQPR